MPTHELGLVFFFAFWVIIMVGVFVCEMVSRRANRKISRIRHVADANYKIDAELWHLLKDEDPHWLAYMGIEPPEYVKRQQERDARDAAERRAAMGSVVNYTRERKLEEKLANQYRKWHDRRGG